MRPRRRVDHPSARPATGSCEQVIRDVLAAYPDAMPSRPVAVRASISGVALVLALVLPLLAAAPAHAVGGTLSGTLTGPDGRRFEYFQVDVYRAAGPGIWEHAVPPRTITSWGTGLPVGDFAIGLPAGSYRACFRPLTFESLEVAGQGCWQGALDVFGATDVVVTEGGTTTITPSLPRESRLRGRVLAPGGTGVSAYVAPYRRQPDGSWARQGGTQSASEGRFVVPDVDPGDYRICLLDVPREFLPECWDDVPTLEEAGGLTVPPGSSVPLTFRLARRATISGTVARPPGSSEPVYVTPHQWNGERWAPVSGGVGIDTDGSYRITGLDAGTYRVCAAGDDVVRTCWGRGTLPAQASDIVLAEGQPRRGVDLAPGPAGFVTGALPEMYLGAQGYPGVTAWRQVGGSWEAEATGEASPTGVGSTWTYRVGSLPTGSYVVCVEHLDPEFVPAFPHTCRGDSPTPQGGVPVDVVAGETTTGVDIPTGRPGELRGRVGGVTTPVRVDLVTAAGRLATSRMTEANGAYRVRDLPPGTFYVGFHRESASSSLAAEWWRNRTDGLGLAGATPIVLDGGVVSGISATLAPGGTLTGRLVDDTGSAVTGCPVRARAADGSLAVRLAVTDASGEFAIGGLSTASYLVAVARRCSRTPTAMLYDADSPTSTSARALDADPVAVTRGVTSSLPADLVTGVPRIASTSEPTITGTPAVGRTLTARNGTWTPTSGLGFRYRWYAGTGRIADATGRRLLLTPDVAGTRIRVRVVATARGWASAVGRSASVGPVAP